MTVDDVVASVEGYGCDLVEITGGEPLLQRDVYPLMEQLLGVRQDGHGRDWRTPEHQERAGVCHPDHGREVPGQRRVAKRIIGRTWSCWDRTTR